MKSTFIIVLTLITSIVSAQEPMTLSLDQAVELAMTHNQNLKNAQLDNQFANHQVKEILSIGLPQISGQAGFTHNYEIATSVLPDFISPSVYGVLFAEGLLAPKQLEQNSFPVQFGVPYTMQAVVGMNQLVADGTYFLGLKAASEFVKISDLLISKSEIDVKEGVIKAYYMAVICDQNLMQMDTSLQNLTKLKEETVALWEAGLVEKLDVDRISLSLSNLQMNISSLKQQCLIARQLLLVSIGIDVHTELTLASDMAAYTGSNFDPSYGMDADGANRIELKILEQQHSLNELDIKRYQVGYFPSLYFNVNYGYNTFANQGDFGNLGSEWYPLGSYGFNLSVPIFDGNYKKSKIDQARVKMMQTENTLEMTRNGIAFDISKARIEYINALNNIQYQMENKELAARIYQATKTKFNEGVGSSFELVQAENDLTTARSNYLNALYQLNIAKINLDKALGLL